MVSKPSLIMVQEAESEYVMFQYSEDEIRTGKVLFKQPDGYWLVKFVWNGRGKKELINILERPPLYPADSKIGIHVFIGTQEQLLYFPLNFLVRVNESRRYYPLYLFA